VSDLLTGHLFKEVSMSPKKAKKKAAKSTTRKATKKSAKSKKSEGFTKEERAAVKERSRELKAEARASKDKAAGESDVLAKISEMKGSDRAMAKQVHEIVKASAPDLAPKTWYGMPAYARDGRVVCFSKARRSSNRGTRRSASATGRTWTKAPCGRPPSR
jgi:hypothetical protein